MVVIVEAVFHLFFKIIHTIQQIASCYIFVIDVNSRMALGNTEHCTEISKGLDLFLICYVSTCYRI